MLNGFIDIDNPSSLINGVLILITHKALVNSSGLKIIKTINKVMLSRMRVVSLF